MPANSLSLIRIVDDDAEMRESLEFLLSTEGWKSRSYASAEAFLETDDVMCRDASSSTSACPA